MTKTGLSSEQLQELLDKAFPPFQGDPTVIPSEVLKDVHIDQYKTAMEFVAQFDQSTASEADWMRLDWATSVPGVVDAHPEIAELVKDHFTLKISYHDFCEVIGIIVTTTAMIANTPASAESVIEAAMEHVKKCLPENLSVAVYHLLTREMCVQCKNAGLPVDQEIMDRYFYRLEA